MSIKYKVCIVESERGWSENKEYEYYDTLEAATERRDSVNAASDPNSDWHMYAEKKIRKVNQ